MIFNFLKAANFLEKYCPGVKNTTHKMRGLNGRGKPLTFSEEDYQDMVIGLDQFHGEARAYLVHQAEIAKNSVEPAENISEPAV